MPKIGSFLRALLSRRRVERGKGFSVSRAKDAADLRLEAETQVRALSLVPKRRFEDLELGFARQLEAPHLPTGVEAGEELFANLRPGAGAHVPAAVCGETLGNDLAMPVGCRHVVRVLSQVVPQRLNVRELLVP